MNEIDELLVSGIEFESRDEMALFLQAVYETLEREGFLSNDSIDPGGLTKWGISKKAYPKLDIRGLTKKDAIKIYYKDYWLKCRINELPNNLKGIMFDGAVNQGISRIVKILQQTTNRKGGSLIVDGKIGRNTISQAIKYKPEPKRMRAYRVKFYCDLIARKPELEKYFYGWFKRAVEV
tara:strand:- start:152 stop:688 length:537 start_codon:yes stop_codon:yes gene_type:complete